MMLNDKDIELKALALVKETKKLYGDKRRQYEDMWGEYDNAWRAVNETTAYEGYGNISAPALMRSVETLLSKEMEILTSPKYPFVLTPEDENAVDSFTIEVNTRIMNRVYDISNAESRLEDILRNRLIYGTAFAKSIYKKEIINKKVPIFVESEEGGKKRVAVELEVTAADYPVFDNVELVDFYCDPRDPELKKSVIESWATNWTYLKSIEKDTGFNNIDMLKDNYELVETEDAKLQKESRANITDTRYASQDQRIVIDEYWGNIPLAYITKKDEDMNTMVPGVIYTAGGFCLGVYENPLWDKSKPYFRAAYMSRTNETYGFGICGPNLSNQQALNDARNMLNDLMRDLVKPPRVRHRMAEIYDENLQYKPDMIIDTNDMNGIRFERPPYEASQVGFNMVGMYERDIQEGTTATKLMQGAPTGATLDRTATGVTTVYQSAFSSIKLYINSLDRNFLQPLFKHQYLLIQQFMSPETIVKLVGQEAKKFVREPLEYLVGSYRILFKGLRQIGFNDSKAQLLDFQLQTLDPIKAQLLGADNIKKIMVTSLRLKGLNDLADDIEQSSNDLEFTPEQEHQKLLTGQKIRIDFDEDHQDHIRKHTEMLMSLDRIPQIEPAMRDYIKRVLAQHIELHNIFLEYVAKANKYLASMPTEGGTFAKENQKVN